MQKSRCDQTERQGAPEAGHSVTVQTFRDLHEIACLREVWKAWQKTRDVDFDFFSGVVRSRGNGCRPHILLLRKNGSQEAMLVGYWHRTRIPIRLCSVTIFQPEVDVLEFVHGGLLGNANNDNCKLLLRAVMRSLAEGEADLAFGEQIDPHSDFYNTAIQLPGFLWRDHCRKFTHHWFHNAPGGLRPFLSSLRQSQRSKMRRKYKKFLGTFAGRIQVRPFRTTAELGKAIRDMEEIASKSIKRRLGFGFFDTPQARDQLHVEAALGWLQIFILYVDEIPVSFWKGNLLGRCLYADHVGFDSTWSEFSPGIFLFLEVIECFRDLEVDTLDFGTGDGQFYQSFAKLRRTEARVRMFAPNFRGLRLSLLHTVAHYLTLLIQGTSYLEWARKILWKLRKSAHGRLAPTLCDGDSTQPHGAILFNERQ